MSSQKTKSNRKRKKTKKDTHTSPISPSLIVFASKQSKLWSSWGGRREKARRGRRAYLSKN
jgi:hypothetical protein